MVSVPYSERRHRIHGDEVDLVKQAVYRDLLRRLRERDDFLVSCTLFRFWYRIETHCRNKPRYPPHDDWEQIEAYLGLGSGIQSRISETSENKTTRLIAGGSINGGHTRSLQTQEPPRPPAKWEKLLEGVSRAVSGSSERVDEGLTWLLGVTGVALCFVVSSG